MKKLIVHLFAFLVVLVSYSQSDLAFYHLGASTPQSSMNNASFFPEAEFYFSFPGMSGLNVNFNSGFTYNHLMTPVEGSDSVRVDLENLLANIKEGDNLRLRGDVSLFQIGVRAGRKSFSLFYNLRYEGGLNYPVQFMNYFVYGNGNFIGQQVEEKELMGGGIAYTEMGIGYTQQLQIMGERKLRIGVRAKYLNGIAHMSTSENASITMLTEPMSFDLSVTFNNAALRTVGFNELQGDDPTSYALGFGGNENKGWAVDLGSELAITDRLTGFAAVNDIGFIKWKQDIETYSLRNSEIILNGFDNLDEIDLSQALEDSLDVWSERDTNTEPFTTSLGARMMIGANYSVLNNGLVSGTISRNGSSYGASEIALGVGYTHQFGKTLTLSTTVLKEESRPMKLGGGFMIRFGFLQLYGAFDDMLNVSRDPADAQGMGVRFGLNFLVGRSTTGKNAKRVKEPKEELSPFPPEYDLDHLEEGDDSQ